MLNYSQPNISTVPTIKALTKEVVMVNYGEHFEDEAPTSMQVHRSERKYSLHKLARAVGNLRLRRGESSKRK